MMRGPEMADRLPLVLVHGWGMSNSVWDPLTPRLERHFELVPIQLPGHGNDRSASRDVDHWVRFCLDQAPEKAWWLGWSLGGQLALKAALENPERFEGVIMMASTPRFVRGEGWSHAVDQSVFDAFGVALLENTRATLLRFLALQARGGLDAAKVLKTLRREFEAQALPSASALEAGLHLLKTIDLRTRLSELKVPVAWVLGQRDTLVPEDMARDLQQLLPSANLRIIDAAGHAPFISHGDECLSAILEMTHAG